MIVFRRRLFFWLLKAYAKRWGKRILFFFLIGLFLFFVSTRFFGSLISKIPIGKKEVIGVTGAYTLDSLPETVLSELSHGLTVVGKDGKPAPDLAKAWRIQDEGKTYIFYLRRDVTFSDGSPFTSETVQYNFSDAQVLRPDNYTIVFKLKDSFSPFLVTVSRPIFKKGFVGTNEYKIRDVQLKGNFVQSLTTVSSKNPTLVKQYQFYPTVSALKTAFVLGEINKALNLTDISYNNTSFATFPNTVVTKEINYTQLVTLFYNTQDQILSDQKVRKALSYAVPSSFPYGQKSLSLYSPFSFAYTDQYSHAQDIAHAKDLLSSSSIAGKNIVLTIKTLSRYKSTADILSRNFQMLGIQTKIELVENIPLISQLFLGDFNVPKDPDQYALWHSGQDTNITHYNSQRIDKFLEDGRKVFDPDLAKEIEERKKIYDDFQKYILDDTPASFLYFPTEYILTKK